MKRLLLLVLVVAGGIVGYSYFLNAPPASADELVMADLEHQFDSASQSMMQATRSTGVLGLDSTADIEAARMKVRRLESELQQLKPRLASDASRQRADRLEQKIRAFREATD
jgi:hypothetical protein